MESTNLLMNLVVAMSVALAGAMIAAWLRQSIIIGFILAGIVIGPNTPGFNSDLHTVEELANIGIVLLMFAIGVEYSLRDLIESGTVAIVGSSIQLVVTIGIGMAVGVALGWDPLEAAFFGAVVAISSSTVLCKVLGERGEMGTGHGKLSLAWSAVQDLYTVILIVLLSALATDSDQLLLDLVTEVGKVGLFLLLLIPVGLRVLPLVLSRVAALRNREVFILTVTAVALGLAYSSTFFGLSLALGAFVAGIVVGETDLSHQILGEIMPLRDIFSGLFFVSVGMLVDPGFVLRNIPLLLLTVFLILIVKGVISAALAWLLGSPTRTAVLVGAIMGVSAEFSFLLARVGRDVNAVTSEVFSLMLAGSAASILVFPVAYRAVQPLATSLGNLRPSFRTEASAPPSHEEDALMRGHAIICGYGRVGAEIGRVLSQRFTVVAVEEDPRIVQAVREQGGLIFQGNSAIPAVLEQANPGRARALIIALPDPLAVRQIVDYVRERYPRLDVVARTHSEDERRYLLRHGVDEVILGEYELALEMTRHALQRFGLGTLEAQQIVQRLRRQLPDEELTPQREGARQERATAADRRRRTRLAEALGVIRGEAGEPQTTDELALAMEGEFPIPQPEPEIAATRAHTRRGKVYRPAGVRHRGGISANLTEAAGLAGPDPALGVEPLAGVDDPTEIVETAATEAALTGEPAAAELAARADFVSEPARKRTPRPAQQRPPEPRHRVQRKPIFGPPIPECESPAGPESQTDDS